MIELLFETEGALKLMWHFIFLSFLNQELLMLELKCKQHAEEFSRINCSSDRNGENCKVCCLFKLFYLKDKVFNVFISQPKRITPVSAKKVVKIENIGAMDVETDLKLRSYTDTLIHN